MAPQIRLVQTYRCWGPDDGTSPSYCLGWRHAMQKAEVVIDPVESRPNETIFCLPPIGSTLKQSDNEGRPLE